MFSPRTLQAKLLVSVFLIVTVMVFSLTALVIYVEKERYQEKELNRIYLMTDAMKKRLGHLMYGKNWRYLMITLTNAKHSDMSIQYFAVTGTKGQVLASDRAELVGRNAFELTTHLVPDTPLYEKEAQGGKGLFQIFLVDYTDSVKGEETLFEATHEIFYLGEPMGKLWVGFSRQSMTQHLLVLTLGMLGTGFVILMATLALIYVVIRIHMAPVDSFIHRISGLDLSREGQSLRDNLTTIPLQPEAGETRDVHQLKSAFGQLCSQFASAWDELENHRRNLEAMVEKRTEDLNQSNERLNYQIQERKEIEARLLTVQKLEAIGTLAGGIAHEFNNLFMAITGYATLIQKRVSQDHPVVEKAEKIRKLVETGSQSVQQLLGFARSGKFDPGPLNLNTVVRSSLSILTRSRKGLAVETDFSKELWAVKADLSQMEQVVMNLLLNGSDAMPGKGLLTIKTRNITLKDFQISLEKTVSGEFVTLLVLDQGRGILPEHLPRIFDPFFTTKEVGQGSGMGLASVFGIIENHGGFITVDSSIGEGSAFKVFLPALLNSARM